VGSNRILFVTTTTVHLPADLLQRLDARAAARGVSRNRVIREALEASLGLGDAWPPELVAMLSQPLEAETADALDASLAVVRSRRKNRRGLRVVRWT
jgi:predicted transcriptional regulator